MKILIPYKDNSGRKFSDPVVSGGIERFIRDIHGAFNDIKIVEITDIYQSPTKVAERVEEEAVGCDLIVSNYPNEGLNVHLNTSVPIAWICHHTAGLDPKWKQVVDNMVEFCDERKNTLWMVTDHQKKNWEALDRRLFNLVSGTINPSHTKQRMEAPVEEIRYEGVTLGRCQKQKDPFMLHRLGSQLGWKTIVMTNEVASEEDYKKANNHWRGFQISLWNLHDEEVRENLKNAGIFLVTWTGETFGIAALEALCSGVPIVMISEDGTSACANLLARPEFGKIIQPNSIELKEAGRELFTLSIDDRMEIAMATRQKFSFYEWKQTFLNLVKEATSG